MGDAVNHGAKHPICARPACWLTLRTMTPDRTHSIVSSRLKLNVSEWGDPDAPPLILQHGGRDHSRSWDAVAAEFAAEYRVIAPDLRGHGDSDWASDGGYHSMDFIYDLATIFDALALPPCAVIGHSLGGSVATRYAALYPDRFTRFVNIEGLGLSPTAETRQDPIDEGERVRDYFEQVRRRSGWTPKRYPDITTVATRLLEIDERLSPIFAEHLAREGTRPNGDGSFSLKYDPAFYDNTPVDISAETRHAMWGRLTCPMLLVYGRQSWASNPRGDGRMAHFRDARLEVIDDAGHWAHHDQHDIFIALTKAFLSEGAAAS